MKPILIYSPTITERLRYILDFLWKSDYELTDSLEFFKKHNGPKISYANERTDEQSCWIKPGPLLLEEKIGQQKMEVSYWHDLPIFFQEDGDLPFDIFAACFYLVSRYEEYLPYEKDRYGRFVATNALAFKEKFLHVPLADLWFRQWETLLQKQFSDYVPTVSAFRYTPTFDMDVPFAFLHKPFYVQIAALAKNIWKANKPVLQQQITTWLKKRPDPFDTFSLLELRMQQYRLRPVFFFPVAKKHGRYDKNPPQSNPAFQRLVKDAASLFEIGIHPSWQSGDSKALLFREKNYLEKISGKKITKSRQHYIRMTLPDTYQNLIELGIGEDYSMGYGSISGWRASTSRPFYWFDLSKNERTSLLVHPFCWMDATAYHQAKDPPEKVYEDLLHCSRTIAQVGGEMITVMHNNYFSDTPDFVRYREAMLRFWQNQFSDSSAT